MAGPTLWCRITVVGPYGCTLGECSFRGNGKPDLDTVDRLARLRLAAARAGATVELTDVSAELTELLDLVGLDRLCG